jgi:hypothetical protein
MLVPWAAGHPRHLGSVGVHHVDVEASGSVARERDRGAVRRPHGAEIVTRLIRQSRERAVEGGEIDVVVAPASAHEEDARAVGGPRRWPIEREMIGDVDEADSVGIRDEDLGVVTGLAREGDPRPVGRPDRALVDLGPVGHLDPAGAVGAPS